MGLMTPLSLDSNARSTAFKKFEKNHLADSFQEENSFESEESNQESDDDKMEDDFDSDSDEVRVSQQVFAFIYFKTHSQPI
jgi:hypothetical protein